MTFDPAAAGWKLFDSSGGFTGLVGPLWSKREGESRIYGLQTDERHGNGRGVIHGGLLMTFIDNALGSLVWSAAERKICATIQLDNHFLAAARPGEFIEARGEVTRRTRAVIFVEGTLTVAERTVLRAKGIWKVLGAE